MIGGRVSPIKQPQQLHQLHCFKQGLKPVPYKYQHDQLSQLCDGDGENEMNNDRNDEDKDNDQDDDDEDTEHKLLVQTCIIIVEALQGNGTTANKETSNQLLSIHQKRTRVLVLLSK